MGLLGELGFLIVVEPQIFSGFCVGGWRGRSRQHHKLVIVIGRGRRLLAGSLGLARSRCGGLLYGIVIAVHGLVIFLEGLDAPIISQLNNANLQHFP